VKDASIIQSFMKFQCFEKDIDPTLLLLTCGIDPSFRETFQGLKVAILTCCHHWCFPIQVLYRKTGTQVQKLGDHCLAVQSDSHMERRFTCEGV